MQTIITRFHGPTNTKGSRISATTASGVRIVRSKNHELDIESAHAIVAMELAKNLGWDFYWHIGSIKTGYVFVGVARQDFGNARAAYHINYDGRKLPC